jgi:hypothetical protein
VYGPWWRRAALPVGVQGKSRRQKLRGGGCLNGQHKAAIRRVSECCVRVGGGGGGGRMGFGVNKGGGGGLRHLVGMCMGLSVWWDGSRRQLPPAAQAELKEAASEGEVMPDWAANSSSQAGENSWGSVCLITEGGGVNRVLQCRVLTSLQPLSRGSRGSRIYGRRAGGGGGHCALRCSRS